MRRSKQKNSTSPHSPKTTEHLLALAEADVAAGRVQQARSAYEQLLKQNPSSGEAHFQLAILLHDAGDLDGAIRHFQNTTRISPDVAELHFNLGTLLSQANRASEAELSFTRAVELNPTFAEAHNNLGIIFKNQGLMDRAGECFRRAVDLNPNFVSALMNLATSLIKLRQANEALPLCQHVLTLQPGFARAYFAMGLAYEQLGVLDEAQKSFAEAVRLNPDTEWAYHLAASCGHVTPSIAPAEYVRSLFDKYAVRFDQHLQGTLNYQTPRQILNAVTAVKSTPYRHALDLGCGTGLCGELIRPIVQRLTGIDLSSEMIQEASHRKIYDALEVTDIQSFLEHCTANFDLVVSSDVFIYIGDLSKTFELVSQALCPDGLFVFSIEAADASPDEPVPAAGYRLNSTRRFSHSWPYIQDLATQYGFIERSHSQTVLRKQAGMDVIGWIVVLGVGSGGA